MLLEGRLTKSLATTGSELEEGEGREDALVDLTTLSEDQIRQLEAAFRYPRGRYGVMRASQLSGVPRRTLHDWAKARVYVPDFAPPRTMMWSYRDLVFLRLFAWLRSKGMERQEVARRVDGFKSQMAQDQHALSTIRSDGRATFVDDAAIDEWTGQTAFSDLLKQLDVFELKSPIGLDDFQGSSLWGPNLIKPSPRTSMSPWIMAGDPCVDQTRIPTIGIFTLRHERGLDDIQIAHFYDIEASAVADAVALEERLHLAA